jgi:hypothetical protein
MKFIRWTEENFDYVKYNPRKNINRLGLSITSLDGGVSGIPDLDSLLEYNKEHNTSYNERDFKTKTPVYDNELKQVLNPIESSIFRSHIIKIQPGGFFPPHRDFYGLNIDSFRLVIPLAYCNPPTFNFIVDDKLQYWEDGYVYFVDTAKMHYLFNAGPLDTYLVVINCDLNENSVRYVTENFKYR